MSKYLHQKGYIYPLGKLSDEENNSFYKKIKEEENFELDKDKFELEYMGKNDYLLWLTYSTYGEKSDEFGTCRPCNQQEIYYYAPKFRDILGEIDTKKLKFIDFCYYNSTECTTDYYLGEEEYKPMTLTEAIQHCKDVSASKCDECGKEHQQLAEWLQELQGYKDETQITEKWLNANFQLICGQWVVYSPSNDGDVSIFHRGRMYYISFNYENAAAITTIGQLRMFLTIFGFGDFAQQLKS